MDAELIQPWDALSRILECARSLGAESVPLDDALGRVLAREVPARLSLPSFDNSAMDGWAVRSIDTHGASRARPVRLHIDGEVLAGASSSARVRARRTVAVMTGAPIPRGADAVVPFEDARREGDEVVLESPVPAGRHVRHRGEDVRRGERILEAGTRLTPAHVAALAAQGLRAVHVGRRPRVVVVATGDELVAPGERLGVGKIYDSNGPSMRALMRAAGYEAEVVRAADEPRELHREIASAIARADVVITLGGVSRGRRDLVPDAWRRARVRSRFAGVAQKPGKPLRFGTRGRTLVFGLPGNPVSAFVGACVYVLPALDRMAGGPGVGLERVRARLAAPVRRHATRWMFLRGRIDDQGRIVPLEHQGSHQVTALARADVLVEIEPGRGALRAGAEVTARRLPGAGAGGLW